MNFAFFGHHKCASTSTSHLCFDICNYLGLNPVYKKTSFHDDLTSYFDVNGLNFLISLNSRYENLKSLPDFVGFHIIRDPRDICVSGYFSHLYSHGLDGFDRLKQHRESLQKLDKEEGLLLEFEFADFWLKDIADWNYKDPRILEIKMENYTEDIIQSWRSIVKWMNLYKLETSTNYINLKDTLLGKINHLMRHMSVYRMFHRDGITDYQLNRIVKKYAFENLANGREMGDENVKSHYRKGQKGDWKNHFSDIHKKVFKEKYGELLIDLGYENDHDW